MIDVSKAVGVAQNHFPYNRNAFYGSPEGLSLGLGLIYGGVRYPLFDQEQRLFDTVEGMVYVITHECDIDPDNARHFNEYVLVCPIILFDQIAEEFTSSFSEAALYGILPDIAGDRVFRVFYFPPHFVTGLEFGGLIYLNKLCSTHVQEFSLDNAKPLCALSGYAQNILDMKLQNHFLRPKQELLPKLN